MATNVIPPAPPAGPPAGWYGDPSGPSGQQRYWDGASWTEHVQFPPPLAPPAPPVTPVAAGPKTHKTRWWAWLLVGLIAIGGIASAGGSGTSSSSSSSGGDDSSAQTVGLNHPISVKGTQYRVLSTRTASALGGEFDRQKANGIYVVVQMQLTNLRNDTHTIDADMIKFVTSDGKTYEPDTDGQLAADHPLILDDVQPDVPKTGTLVYDVPPTAVSGGQLRVEDMFSSSHGFISLGL